jgi:phosphoglycerate dehydrogenase-like enzyme
MEGDATVISGNVLVTAGILLDVGPEGIAPLQEAGLTIKAPSAEPLAGEALIRELQGCVAVIAGGELYDDDVFSACPELKVLARWGIGYDSIDVPAATSHGVMVINTPRLVTQAVADMTFALILGIARRLPYCDRAVRAGEWPGVFSAQVWEKTLGLVGLGQIGQAVAHRARGFSMRLLVHDPYCEDGVCETLQAERAPLEKVLSQSDFVSLHCTMCPETRQLINAETLRLMKPTAYLINAGRGGLVDQAALTKALQERWIAGAALDVLAEEPPDPHDPLLQLDNVLLTPHCSSFTYDTVARVNRQACQNVIDALSGQRPAALLNPEVLG